MKNKYRVTYDSWSGDKFIVHKPNKEIWFTCSKNGLYFHDTNNRQINLLNTVQENMTGLSKRQIENAKKSRELYVMVGHPSIKDFRTMIQQNMILNYPITDEDVTNSIEIYGPDI